MLSEKRIMDIISYTKDLKKQRRTNDPYRIADYFGIIITEQESCYQGFTAQAMSNPGYPTLIWINDAYTDYSKKVLCAHELAHALFHTDGINHFATGAASLYTDEEHEANLFAVTLLTNDSVRSKLSTPIEKMDNSMLKAILDYNLFLKV